MLHAQFHDNAGSVEIDAYILWKRQSIIGGKADPDTIQYNNTFGSDDISHIEALR